MPRVNQPGYLFYYIFVINGEKGNRLLVNIQL